jgi:hypothetical protein
LAKLYWKRPGLKGSSRSDWPAIWGKFIFSTAIPPVLVSFSLCPLRSSYPVRAASMRNSS